MHPFDKYRASVFVVTSPFQALCAVAAIRQLEINDYKFLALLPEKEERNNQLTCFLDNQNIKYTAIITNSTSRELKLFQIKALLKRRNRYTRLFVGDFRSMTELYLGCRYISDKSDIIYLDDGNITVSVLKDIISFEKKGKYLELLSLLRGFQFYKNFLTVYGDIFNTKYCVEPLSLEYIAINKKENALKSKKGIYIVGTNLRLYCRSVGITEEQYIKKLDSFLDQLKIDNPGQEIVFIPHGRDHSDYARVLCNKHGVVFRPSKLMVELELLYMSNTPLAIYGYTSSALYSLKKMFPETEVYNILLEPLEEGRDYKEYLALSEYYLANGISLIKEVLP